MLSASGRGFLEKQVQDLLRRVADLEAERLRDKATIEEQKKTIRELERELEEWRRGFRVRDKRTPERQRAADGQPPKRPGRPAGHPGVGRPGPRQADRLVAAKPVERCPDCGGSCRPNGRTRCRLVDEVVVRREAVGYESAASECVRCGAVHWSPLPAELGPSPKLGVNAQSLAMALRNDIGLSFGKVGGVLRLMGLPVSKGALQQMAHRIRVRTDPTYQEILARARTSRVLGMDETGARHEGHKAWLWLARSPELSLFHLDRSRSHEVVEQLLGDHFDGVLVVDFYSAYRSYGHGDRQYCWPHLIREARKIAELAPCHETRRFLERLRLLYHRAKSLHQAVSAPEYHGLCIQLGRLRSDPILGQHKDVARLQKRMGWADQSLFTFVGRPEVPPGNNGSEQDIRAYVIFRKVGFCTRSDEGAKTLSQLLSIGQTLRKQEWTWAEYLPRALAAHWTGHKPASVFAPRPARSRGANGTRETSRPQSPAASAAAPVVVFTAPRAHVSPSLPI